MADTYGCSARILVNGRKVREYERNEDGAIFVESRINSEYEIELKNHLGTKVLAIVSVDGLDVISGKLANNSSPGYILKPYSSMVVKGFRKDDNTVGAFRFVDKPKSYASGQGNGGNEGVISVRFFDEKQQQILFANQNMVTYSNQNMVTFANGNVANIDPTNTDWNPNQHMSFSSCDTGYTCSAGTNVGIVGESTAFSVSVGSPNNPDQFCGNMRNVPSSPFHTGTTWGTKKHDKVYKKDFERGNIRGEIIFYYTTKDGLKSLGVPVVEEKYVSYPKGFSDYATPPKGWA